MLGEVDPGLLLDGLSHGNPTEAFGEVDVVPHPVEGGLAEFLAEGIEEPLDPRLHGTEVAISLIKLDGGEFWVVAGIDAFVAEDPADLIDPVDAADHAFLEV